MRVRRTMTTLALAAALAAGSGCGPGYPEDDPYEGAASAPALDRHEVFESFEFDPEWVTDSADDPAAISRSPVRATHGVRSLRARFRPGTRRKVSIRREVSLDLSGARSATVDVWTAEEGLALALALVTEPGGRYFESRAAGLSAPDEAGSAGPATTPVDASPLKWRTVRFRLDGPFFKCAESGWLTNAPIANAHKTSRIILILYTNEYAGTAGEGEVFVDRLSFDKPLAELGATFPPRGVSALPRTHRVRVWGRFDLLVAFEASHTSPFDAREIRVYADVCSPSGSVLRVPGFIDKDGLWRIRYMPLERGRHTYEVGVRNAVGRRTLPPDTFVAVGETGRGPVRVSRRDPRHFEYASGEPFYPVGTNVAWASDFSLYFRKSADAGVNLVRVWLAPWSLPVASRTKAGDIDLAAADRLEQVLGLASEHGLLVQLVFGYHGEFIEGWTKSPYSAANGGPCAVPAEFFTHPEARAAFRTLLRYVAARHASHPALFGWELFNEVDLPPRFSEKTVAYWHREMASCLRANDPAGHPITTSVARFGDLAGLDGLAGIDFLQAHFYRPDIDRAVLNHWAAHASRHKPTFIGEFGGSATARHDQKDTRGVRLRTALWLSLASPASGTALPWWWDTHIDPQDLYGLWRPVAALGRRIDRRGRNWRFVHEAFLGGPPGPRQPTAAGPPGARPPGRKGGRAPPRGAPAKDPAPKKNPAPRYARVQGILARNEGLLYFYDPRVLIDPSRTPSVLPRGGAIILRGLVDGQYAIELWEGTGERASTEKTGVAKGGRLRVALAPSEGDFALYFRAAEAGEPGIVK